MKKLPAFPLLFLLLLLTLALTPSALWAADSDSAAPEATALQTAAQPSVQPSVQPSAQPSAQVPTPVLAQPENWTLVVIPDPQQYAEAPNHERYAQMMNWVAANLEPLRVQQVLCTGDLVNANQNPKLWQATSKAFEVLDGKTPYVLCTGNHDYGGPKATADSRETHLSEYFPMDRNPAWKGVLVEAGVSAAGQKSLENAAYQFTVPGGQKVLVVSIQFAPTDQNLEWVRSVAKKYADHFVILTTHNYQHSLSMKNVRSTNRAYKVLKEDGNTGEDIWQKLVKSTPNIRMVISGHISKPDDFTGCVGWRTDLNDAGKTVYQMLFDTQALGGGWGGNGGDGWLRMLEFTPDMKHVKAYTYSPFFAQNPETAEKAFETSDFNAFEFEID